MRMAVFASGNGSNFEAIANSKYDYLEVSLLICDNSNAYVLERSKRLKIPAQVFLLNQFKNKIAYETEILKILKKYQIDVIALAGYMKIIGKTLLEAYPNRIINIHPSILPDFKGLNAISEAYKNNVEKIGITIHYVNEDLDGGEIIAQDSFLIGDKSLEEVEMKIHELEHKLYPKVIKTLFDWRSNEDLNRR
ncbi:MAG: phosphoribosylglycinamide formyltransferase [Bacilli bacterium]|nr:phosphoribosylglycinamide formyltransferase [Bacilli bacterium]